MRTHPQIIADLDGPLKVARMVHDALGGDFEVIRKRVHAWASSGSIPGEYWPLFERAGAATVTELAAAAERRKLGSSPNTEAA